MTKALASCCLAFALGACSSTNAALQDLSGLWTLTIRDPRHKEVSTLVIRFSDERGESCIGGEWKRVIVEGAKTSDKNFFPVSDPLTYEIRGSELLIGRNNVCDGYLRLRGKFDGERAEGAYYAFGLGGGSDLGEFSLQRSR